MIFDIQTDEFVTTEMERANGRAAFKVEDCAHPFLTKDIYLAGSEFGFIGSNGQERLYWLISQG